MTGRRIGITTTVPVEVILAAGAVPVDLNNLFITADDRAGLIRAAEIDGYPRNVCGWIKGIYGALKKNTDITTVIAVTAGDCSNTHALMETLELVGVSTIPFAYPYDRERRSLEREIGRLAERLGTTIAAAEDVRRDLEKVRASLDRMDELTWHGNRVHGGENHLWLVSSSDFDGDPEAFTTRLDAFIAEVRGRQPFREQVRLACMGVPPILDDMHDVLEEAGARVVYNEVQHQFSMPRRAGDIVEQYRDYTYPYSVFHRLDAVLPELERRSVHGVVHYVQSFCHRHIEDIVVRDRIPVPVLTIEGEAPGLVDARTKLRLQAFVEMLADGAGTAFPALKGAP